MNGFRWLILAGLLVVGLAGCLPEEPELDIDSLYAYTPAPLAVMLQATGVNGRVNYPLIEAEYADYLDRFVELAAEHGPRSQRPVFFKPGHRAAYYINVHNGLVMQTWMQNGAGSGDRTLRFDPAWLDERRHVIDGQTVSINDVAELAKTQGFRLVPLVLITGTVTGPLVPSPPLNAETFELSLDRQVREFLTHPATFQRIPKADGIDFIYEAPPVLRDEAERLGDLEMLIERFLPEMHPFKMELIRAVRDGTLTFREPSDLIHLPDF